MWREESVAYLCTVYHMFIVTSGTHRSGYTFGPSKLKPPNYRIHTMKCFSKKEEIPAYSTTWTLLKNVVLSERSKTQKNHILYEFII